jgi:hypothetical protein
LKKNSKQKNYTPGCGFSIMAVLTTIYRGGANEKRKTPLFVFVYATLIPKGAREPLGIFVTLDKHIFTGSIPFSCLAILKFIVVGQLTGSLEAFTIAPP